MALTAQTEVATDAGEVRRLRKALRDLVALSTIPAAWVDREPTTIAVGLAEALVGWLRLDFAFVRLRDPGGGGAASEGTRGDAWKDFFHWLQRHDAAGRPAQREIVPDVGGGTERYAGLVVPIGVDGAAGLVAVACARRDFPTETDHLLLSVASNHAAAAFGNASLAQERRSALEQVRQTRAELETKVAERAAELHRTGSELRTILDASPLGMVLLRRDLAVQRCNPAFERLFGWTADEVVGRLFPVDERLDERWTPLAARLEGGNAFSGLEVRLRRKDGSELDAALAAAPLRDEEGRPAGLVATIEDIGDRRRAEESLRQARTELAHVTRLTSLGELAASIAHEIQQPLAAIVADATASLNWLARAEPEVALAREAIGDIVTEGHRAAEIVQRIRQLATKSDPHKARLEINDVIQSVARLLRTEVLRHRAPLRLTLAAGLPGVLGDRVQLQQVILNLLMNGVEAMEAVNDRPRRLEVRSQLVAGDRVRVAVVDAGAGFEPDDVDRMFEAFFTTKPGGMGMGLSISRSIVEAHGGRLWATPNPEHGATFQFELPALR